MNFRRYVSFYCKFPSTSLYAKIKIKPLQSIPCKILSDKNEYCFNSRKIKIFQNRDRSYHLKFDYYETPFSFRLSKRDGEWLKINIYEIIYFKFTRLRSGSYFIHFFMG